MNKKLLLLFISVIVLVAAIVAGKFLWQTKQGLKNGNQTAIMPTHALGITPTPTLAPITIVSGDDNTKHVTLPTFNISFSIPSDFTRDTTYSGGACFFGNCVANS